MGSTVITAWSSYDTSNLVPRFFSRKEQEREGPWNWVPLPLFLSSFCFSFLGRWCWRTYKVHKVPKYTVQVWHDNQGKQKQCCCSFLLLSIMIAPVVLLNCYNQKHYSDSKQHKHNRELKQPRRRRQQQPHTFAYLTMKNSICAGFALAFFNVWHFVDVLVLSVTWNDQFCSCVDDVSKWWQMFKFVFLCPKRWFQFNSRIVGAHFSSITSLNNWKMIAETRS